MESQTIESCFNECGFFTSFFLSSEGKNMAKRDLKIGRSLDDDND